MRDKLILFLGPFFCFLVYSIPNSFISPEADLVMAVGVWMILWWITEVVSISVTALIPLTFYPLLGIMKIKEVSAFYGHPIIFLFFGGFVMALTLEKVRLHKRIALNIIKITGTRPDRVVLGFLVATSLLSMWISNTATTVLMLPIAYSVIQLLGNDEDGITGKGKNFSLSIMLGIAYAANVGGTATLIGTPPNIVLAGFMESEYNYSISFFKWMVVGVPFAIIMIGFIYFLLTKVFYKSGLESFEKSGALIDSEIEKLGPLSVSEKMVMVIFIFAIFLWIARSSINSCIPGLNLTDTTISLVAAFVCFCMVYKGELVFEWEDTKRLPWGILILFGGGLSLANGLSQAGIIDLIGGLVSNHSDMGVLAISIILIAVMLFMTELMSNVALVAICAPMVAGVATGLDIGLSQLLIPVVMASSCAFMLPMSTPPNAIVFASGHIKVADMAKAGIFLNLISIVLLVVFFKFIIAEIFSF